MKNISILVLVGFAAWLRLSHLGDKGMYTDENFTLLNANGFWVGGANQKAFKQEIFTPRDFWEQKNYRDFFEAVAHSDFGTHIVYNGFMFYWMRTFGYSDFMVRLPSVIFCILSIWLVYYLCLAFLNSHYTGLLAGFMLSVDPFYVAQAHIARSYMLSFLLILGATWAFLKILKPRPKLTYIVLYGLLICLSLLNHYLNFLVPLSHGLVFLFLRKKNHLWLPLVSVAVVATACMVLWFTWGGGYTALNFLQDKNSKHLLMAQQATANGVVGIGSLSNVSKKALSLIMDSQIFSLDLFKRLNSIKLLLVALLNFICWYGGYALFKKGNIKYGIILILIGAVILSIFKAHFSLFLITLLISLIYTSAIKTLYEEYQNPELNPKLFLLGVCSLLLFLSVGFLSYDALKNGHTTSLARRYIGLSIPFTAIFIAYGFNRLKSKTILYPIILVFLIYTQYPIVQQHIVDYWSDNSADYAWFKPTRVSNPYHQVAKTIEKNYEKGDTLVIPGAFTTIYQNKFDKIKTKQCIDAQLINLYLPKNAEILETIDPNERNLVWLKRKNGTKFQVFDFKETQFRY